jgi:hypothetical protein
MAQASRAKIQLCGRLAVELGGRWVEDALPGANGRLLFAYLVLNRLRPIDRDQLLTAVYGEKATPDHRPRLSVLLSKLRHVVGSELLVGRSEIELVLPPESFVDVEAAFEALHRAQSHVANGEWAEAWGPSGVAYHVASRPCCRVTTVPGWTSGDAASTRFGCAGSSASQRQDSAWAGRRCRRPKSAHAGSSSWLPTVRPATGS